MKLAFAGGLVSLGLACWLGPAVWAQEHGADAEKLFQRLDANGDGKLSGDELSKERARFFNRLLRIGDADKDGQLTKDEFLKGMQEPPATDEGPQNPEGPGFGGFGRRSPGGPERMFEMFDRDGDGKLTREELPEPAREGFERLFERLGKDSLTLDDLRRFGGGPGARGPGNPAGAMFDRLDANKDGRLTLDEMPEPMRARLEPMPERAGKEGLTREEFVKFAGPRFESSVRERRPGNRPGDGNARTEADPNRPAGEPGSPRFDRRRPRDGEGRMRGDAGRPGPPFAGGPPRFDRRRPRDGGERMRGESGRPMPPFAGGPPRGPAIIERLDTNSDGKISREELAKAVEQFDALDSNKDGSIDAHEAMGHPPRGFERGQRESSGRAGGRRRARRPPFGGMRRFGWFGGSYGPGGPPFANAPWYGMRPYGSFGGPGRFHRPPFAGGPSFGFFGRFDRGRGFDRGSDDDSARANEMRRPERFGRADGPPNGRGFPFFDMRRSDRPPGDRFAPRRGGRPDRPRRPEDADSPRASTQPPGDEESTELKRARFLFGSLDTDKDGQISSDEWGQSRSVRRTFERAAIEVSLPVSEPKFVEMWVQARSTPQRRGRPDAPRRPEDADSPRASTQAPGEEESTELKRARLLFGMIDADKDGQVSSDEWGRSFLRRTFERAAIQVSLPVSESKFVEMYVQAASTQRRFGRPDRARRPQDAGSPGQSRQDTESNSGEGAPASNPGDKPGI